MYFTSNLDPSWRGIYATPTPHNEKDAGSSPTRTLRLCHRFVFSLQSSFMLWFNASFQVDSEIVSEISRGLMVLVGIGVGKSHSTIYIYRAISSDKNLWPHTDDNASDIENLSKKMSVSSFISSNELAADAHDHWHADYL